MVVGAALGFGALGVAFTEEYLRVMFGIAVLALFVFIVGSRIARSVRMSTEV